MARPHTPERLSVLLADYSECRNDDRSYNTAFGTLFGVAASLLGLLAVATTQTCSFATGKSCVHVPDFLEAAAPLVPLTVFAYAQTLSTMGTLRNYYLRGLEDEIRSYSPGVLTAFGADSLLPPMSYIGMTTELGSLRRGRTAYRMLVNFVFLAVILIFGSLTLYVAFHVTLGYRIGMLLVYGPAAFLLISEMLNATIGGRSLFVKTVQNYTADKQQRVPSIPKSVTVGERSLLSYLLIPRPEDLVKWLIAPAAFTIVAWSTGSFYYWHRFMLLWLTFEYLIYNARYQWNDTRGIDEDRAHAARASRQRLPTGSSERSAQRSIAWSLATALFRLLMALAIGSLTGQAEVVGILIGLVFITAVAYEILRTSSRAQFQRDIVEHPPGAGSGHGVAPGLRIEIYSIWIIVGFGYAIRAGVGFAAARLPVRDPITICGLSFFVALGITFVLLTWSLEASSYCRRRFSQATSRWVWYQVPALQERPHIADLLRYTDVNPDPLSAAPVGSLPAEPVAEGPAYGGSVRILRIAGHSRSPWNIAFIVSAALSGAAGCSLVFHHASVTRAWAAAVVVGACGSAVIVAVRGTGERLIVAFLGTGLLALLALRGRSPFPDVILCTIPWVAIVSLFIMFYNSSYSDLKRFALPTILHSAQRLAAKAALIVLHAIVGPQTWRYLQDFPGPGSPRA